MYCASNTVAPRGCASLSPTPEASTAYRLLSNIVLCSSSSTYRAATVVDACPSILNNSPAQPRPAQLVGKVDWPRGLEKQERKKEHEQSRPAGPGARPAFFPCAATEAFRAPITKRLAAGAAGGPSPPFQASSTSFALSARSPPHSPLSFKKIGNRNSPHFCTKRGCASVLHADNT